MTKDRERPADLHLAKRLVQEMIHDPSRPPEIRQRARLAAVEAQRLIDRNDGK